MAKLTYPIIDLTGTPFECGQQYGNSARQLITNNIEAYKELIEYHIKINFNDAIKYVSEYIPFISNNYTTIMEEMEGIALGAGKSIEEILLLNLRSELLSQNAPSECTAVSFLPDVCRDNNTWLAQNWDWYEATKGLTVILRINQVGKPKILTIVEAGQVGKMGINNQGIGLCLNFLLSSRPRIGAPLILLCRAILNSNTIVDAINELYKVTRASAGNFLIGHKDGFIIDFETTPNDIDFIEPTEGYIVHTNHFISDRFKQHDRGLRNRGGDSLIRKQIAEKIIQGNLGKISIDTIKSIQQNLTCKPYSICRLPIYEEPRLAQWTTMFGVIMNLTKLEILLTNGNPNIEPYIDIVPFY